MDNLSVPVEEGYPMSSRLHRSVRLSIQTYARCELIEVTDLVRKAIRKHDVREGLVFLHVPHTTAGICVNENADPDVKLDLLRKLELMIPKDEPFYRHAEGNSDSHLKAILTGTGVTIHVERGELLLGQWQGIYFCEFDGPRTRELIVRCLDGGRDPLS